MKHRITSQNVVVFYHHTQQDTADAKGNFLPQKVQHSKFYIMQCSAWYQPKLVNDIIHINKNKLNIKFM